MPDSMIMQLVDGNVGAIDMVPLEKAVRAGDPYAKRRAAMRLEIAR